MKATTVYLLIVLNSCIFLSHSIDESTITQQQTQQPSSTTSNPIQTTGRLLSTPPSSRSTSTNPPVTSPGNGNSNGNQNGKTGGLRFKPVAQKRAVRVDRHNLLKQVSPTVKASAMANIVASELGQGIRFSHAKDSNVGGERTYSIFFDQLAQQSSLKVAGCGYSYHENKEGRIKTLDNLLNITYIDWDYPSENGLYETAILSVLSKYVSSIRQSLEVACEMQVFPSSYCDKSNVDADFDGIATVGWYCQVSPLNDIFILSAMDLSNICPPMTNNQTAVASTVYNGAQPINTFPHAGTHYLEDTNRTNTVVDCNNGACSGLLLKLSDPQDIWNATNERIPTQVQWGASQVLDYFKLVWGRNGLDGMGGPKTIQAEDGSTQMIGHKVHYGVNQTYAMWTGFDFVYGDGDGITYGPMVALDIIAHEMSHAIVEYECNLDYSYQAGALRESFGDIVAAVIDYWTFGESNKTWAIGEDVYTPGIAGDAMRYMNNPHLADEKNFTFNDDPDHVSEMYNGTLDNGGVHVNSGIPNKVFHLLAKGGNHSNGGPFLTGIGIDAAFAIWYRAVTVYFSSTTDFAGARSATLHAAIDLYSSSSFKYTELSAAWALCGVGSLPVPTQNVIVNGGFEGDTTGWLVWGQGAVYVRVASDKRSGYGVMRLGVNNNWQGFAGQTFYVPINSVVANLTFWVWTTSSDSTTAVRDRFTLELTNSTNNALLDQLHILTNLDTTTGYVQKVVNLLPYMGIPSLRLDFRANNDGNAPTVFRIDDVALNIVTY